MGDPAGPTNATPTPEPQRRDAAPPPRPADRPADRPDEPLTRPGREVTPSGPAPTTDRPSTDADSPISSLLAEADGALADGRPAIAREVLNRALHHRAATAAERAYLRDRLQQLADILTFSTRVVPGDAMVREYAVQSGDFLSTIARREGVRTDWRFIQRINDMDNPNRLHVGQDLKLVQGPFHAVVDKSDYRLDLYADDRDSAGNRLFLASFNVGLGEFNSTPSGRWVVKNRLENPGWTNPRDGRESYGPDDPQNPIGEYWVGLDGVDDHNRAETGIGLHGTIEPDTIGQQASMGCVRLLPNDIQLLYEVLIPGESEVVIRD
jgi:LysM repeat protein